MKLLTILDFASPALAVPCAKSLSRLERSIADKCFHGPFWVSTPECIFLSSPYPQLTICQSCWKLELTSKLHAAISISWEFQGTEKLLCLKLLWGSRLFQQLLLLPHEFAFSAPFCPSTLAPQKPQKHFGKHGSLWSQWELIQRDLLKFKIVGNTRRPSVTQLFHQIQVEPGSVNKGAALLHCRQWRR